MKAAPYLYYTILLLYYYRTILYFYLVQVSAASAGLNYKGTAPWPTPAYSEALRALVHSDAQPLQARGLVRRQQARPRPLSKR